MGTIVALIVFVYLTYKAFRLLNTSVGYLRSPYDKRQLMACSGHEMLVVLILTTGILGLLVPAVISIRLLLWEVLCVLGIIYSKNRPITSVPVILYFVFVAWIIIGITYSPSAVYGSRMLLKYIYPLLIVLFTSAVVRDGELMLKSMMNVRKLAFFSILALSLPFLNMFFGLVFWHSAALATMYITIAVFSLGMVYFSNEKRKNMVWFIIFCLPCVLWVIRTDIMGTMVALSAFFVIKYRLKSLPILVVLACLSVASIFCIPRVKEKMYFRPDEVTFMDFITNNVDENNINTSGRSGVWEEVKPFYETSKVIGQGTGCVQKYIYTEMNQVGGQLHGDFLVLLCDNGIVGLVLFLLAYGAGFLHCIVLYHRYNSSVIRLCTLVAGASLLGVMVTMYSDNTVSYSMATLSYPWGLYGMALGLIKAEKQKVVHQ